MLLLAPGNSHSQDSPQKVIPPIAGKTKASDKQGEKPKNTQEITVNFPPSINVTMGGETKIVSDTQKPTANDEPSKWADPVTWFTFVLAAANILLWLTTKDIAKSANESADSYQVSERAWIGWSGIDTMLFSRGTSRAGVETGPGVEFFVKITNGGRTPAIRCHTIGEGNALRVGYDEPPPVFQNQMPQNPRELGTVIPGFPLTAPPIRFFESDIDGLRNRTHRMFLYARMDYDTVFGASTRRHTEVCLEVFLVGETPGTTLRWRFVPIGPQNSAT
jgi:hypothetical protein